MAFIVETGSGIPGANALASVAFVDAYLADRGRSTENGWSGLSDTVKKQKIVAGTDYIEQRFGQEFRGEKANLDVEGREASGTLTLTVLPLDGSTIVIGQKTYRMVDALENPDDILIGADVAETNANIAAAINLDDGAGETYEEHTLANYEALAVDQVSEVDIVALTTGESGNLIAFSTTIVGATATGSGFLTGGVDEGEQPLSFPRVDLYSNDGRAVVGVPLKVKMATAEYSVRAAAAALTPDPVVDDRYLPVLKKREKVGPIEEETQYGASNGSYIVPYPAADALLAEYLEPTGQAEVIRG